MKDLNPINTMLYLLLIAAWAFGVAIVKGFWMTLVCFIIPPISWVVLAEFTLTHLGLI